MLGLICKPLSDSGGRETWEALECRPWLLSYPGIQLMALITIDSIPVLKSCGSHTISWASTLNSLSNVTLSIFDLHSNSTSALRTLVSNSLISIDSFTWDPVDVSQGQYVAELKAIGQIDANTSSQGISSSATFAVETGPKSVCLSPVLHPRQYISPTSDTSTAKQAPTYTYDLHKVTRTTIIFTVSSILLIAAIYFIQRWFRKRLSEPKQTYLRRRDFLVALTRRMALSNTQKSSPAFLSIASVDTRSDGSSSRYLDLSSSMIATTPGSRSMASTSLGSMRSLASRSNIATRGYATPSYRTTLESPLASPTMLRSPSSSRNPRSLSFSLSAAPTSRVTSFVPTYGRSMASDVATCDKTSFYTATPGGLESPALARCPSTDSNSLRYGLFPMDDPFSDTHHV